MVSCVSFILRIPGIEFSVADFKRALLMDFDLSKIFASDRERIESLTDVYIQKKWPKYKILSSIPQSYTH